MMSCDGARYCLPTRKSVSGGLRQHLKHLTSQPCSAVLVYSKLAFYFLSFDIFISDV